MPITFKRAGQEAVTLENVSFKGVALDKVTFKRAGQEAVTVFENVTEDALAGTWVFNDTLDFSSLGLNQDESKSWFVNFTSLAEYLNAPNTIKIEYGMVDAGEDGNEYIGYSLIYVYTPTSGIAEPYTVYISNSSIGFLGWNVSEQTTKNKTITITSKLSEVTNGEQLLAWLQANATKQ